MQERARNETFRIERLLIFCAIILAVSVVATMFHSLILLFQNVFGQGPALGPGLLEILIGAALLLELIVFAMLIALAANVRRIARYHYAEMLHLLATTDLAVALTVEDYSVLARQLLGRGSLVKPEGRGLSGSFEQQLRFAVAAVPLLRELLRNPEYSNSRRARGILQAHRTDFMLNIPEALFYILILFTSILAVFITIMMVRLGPSMIITRARLDALVDWQFGSAQPPLPVDLTDRGWWAKARSIVTFRG